MNRELEEKQEELEDFSEAKFKELSAKEIEQILNEHDSWFEQLAEYDKVK